MNFMVNLPIYRHQFVTSSASSFKIYLMGFIFLLTVVSSKSTRKVEQKSDIKSRRVVSQSDHNGAHKEVWLDFSQSFPWMYHGFSFYRWKATVNKRGRQKRKPSRLVCQSTDLVLRNPHHPLKLEMSAHHVTLLPKSYTLGIWSARSPFLSWRIFWANLEKLKWTHFGLTKSSHIVLLRYVGKLHVVLSTTTTLKIILPQFAYIS